MCVLFKSIICVLKLVIPKLLNKLICYLTLNKKALQLFIFSNLKKYKLTITFVCFVYIYYHIFVLVVEYIYIICIVDVLSRG